MTKAYIGIGSNLGDRYANCDESVKRIQQIEDVRVNRVSGFYETSPVGPPQPMYVNGVMSIETGVGPYDLLSELKAIEKSMGREVTKLKDLPRVIDLDILLYGDAVLKTESLEIPHPRMHERAFVLKGLSEIAPDERHPVLGKTFKDLLCEIQTGKRSL
ncbi:MAG: 2-amino-4-hydroxy-6-hydroxymethyldihydropteridine diphosphokinase [Candidatus Omnitrophota bacterium]